MAYTELASNRQIINCLQKEYGLQIKSLTRLSIGADSNAAVYEAVSVDQTHYFLKLRNGPFAEAAVTLPSYLSKMGTSAIIACIPTKNGKLWSKINGVTLLLYPFVTGKNGYEQRLSEQNWADFGRALQRIHAADIPANIIAQIRREDFSPTHRERVTVFLEQVEADTFSDPVAIELAEFLIEKRPEIVTLLNKTEALAKLVQSDPLDFVVCHSDLHAGNLLINPNESLFIVDWDQPILAPKERDLMYIGGALLASGLTPAQEEARFYQTYGATKLNQRLLTYYRCERIIEDISAYCEELLLSADGEEREQSLAYLKSNFLPGHTLEAAYRA